MMCNQLARQVTLGQLSKKNLKNS